MAVTMDMLEVIQMNNPNGKVPDGMKVTALSGPNGGPVPSNPVLAIGGFTLWPMSYYDNRVSFGMVMYDLEWNVVCAMEKPGARYIYKIVLAGTGTTGTITFYGQADQTVVMNVGDLEPMMCAMAIS